MTLPVGQDAISGHEEYAHQFGHLKRIVVSYSFLFLILCHNSWSSIVGGVSEVLASVLPNSPPTHAYRSSLSDSSLIHHLKRLFAWIRMRQLEFPPLILAYPTLTQT